MQQIKALVARYLAHVTMYVVAGATIISGLNPQAIPPKYAFLTALAGVVVNAAHHGFTIAQASPIAKAALDAAVKAAVNAATAPIGRTLASIMLLPLLLTLHGCATVSGWFNSPSSQPIIIAAVEVAVTTAEQKGVPGVQINAIAKQALLANQSTGATLATVAAAVNQELKRANLPDADINAAQILESALAVEIQVRIGTNTDLAAARAAVTDVLNAVIEATGG